MLVIRLSRTGRRNQPKFRMVVAEDRSKLTGKPVAILGHYQPTDKDKPLVMDKEAVSMWISKGAQPSNTVAKILNGHGFDLKVHQNQPAKPKKEPKEAPQAAPAAAVAEEAPEAAETAPETPTESVEDASPEVPAEEPVVEEPAVEAEPVAEQPAAEADTAAEETNGETPSEEAEA